MNQKSTQLKMNEQIHGKKGELFTLQCQLMDLPGGVVDRSICHCRDVGSTPGQNAVEQLNPTHHSY